MTLENKRLPYIAGLLVAAIFGLSFLFTKNALDRLDPLSVLAFRFALAAVLLSLFALFGIIKIDLKGKPIKGLLVLTIFQPLLYFPFEILGVQLTSSAETGMMIAMVPVSVAILGYFFANEKLSISQGISILISVSGIVYIGIHSNVSASNSHFLGYLFLLGAIIAGGIYSVMARKASALFTPAETTFVMMWAGAIVFNGALIFRSASRSDFSQYLIPFSSLPTFCAILYLGILSSIIAFFMLNYMLSKLPAYKTTVFMNLAPVISIFAGVLFRHEVLFSYHLVGCVLIIAGVWGTNMSNRKEIT